MSPELFVLIHFFLILTYVEFVYFSLGFVNDFCQFFFPVVIIELVCTLELEYSLFTSDPKKNQELNVLEFGLDANLLKVQNTSRWLFILKILFSFVILQTIVG